MNKIRTIQLKAVFLLIVFSLNIIIGFACAVGLDMGFNSNHHEEAVTKSTEHVHADGKKYHHKNEVKDHHDEKVKDHHEGNEKDNCCNDHVTKIVKQDKAIASSISINTPICSTIFITGFYNVDAMLAAGINSHIKYLVRRHHPPIPDIRVAIRSFQI
jgi:ABC-type nickel/cobalt efflux system permease component RcnA